MTIKVVPPVRPQPTTKTSGRRSRVIRAVVPVDGAVGLVNNGKQLADALLVGVADALRNDGRPALSHHLHTKVHSAYPISAEVRADLTARSQMIITGVGDCGACSACSLQDAVICAEAGVPSVVLLTTPFAELARATLATFGVAAFPFIVVDHPLFTRDAQWIDQTAQRIAAEIADGGLATIADSQ